MISYFIRNTTVFNPCFVEALKSSGTAAVLKAASRTQSQVLYDVNDGIPHAMACNLRFDLLSAFRLLGHHLIPQMNGSQYHRKLGHRATQAYPTIDIFL